MNMGWGEGVDPYIHNGEYSGILYQIQTWFSDMSTHHCPVQDQITMPSCWQQYHDPSLVDPSTFQFLSY